MNVQADMEELAAALPVDMVAVRMHGYGAPSVIEVQRIALPVLKEHEVLVKVAAAGVGPWDGWMRGCDSMLPQPLTLGSDIAGTVVKAGSKAGFTPGQRVYGITNKRFAGGCAE